MPASRIRIRKFGNHFSTVIHGDQEYLAEVSFWQFFDINARARSHRARRDVQQALQIELDAAAGKLAFLVPEPSPGGVVVELGYVTVAMEGGGVVRGRRVRSEMVGCE